MKKIYFLITLTTLMGCFGKDPERTGLEGKPLPSFDLLLPDSTTNFNTANIPAGKPIVLFYFGPYCPYSQAQMGEIIKHMKELEDIQFYVFTSYPFPDMKTFYNYFQLNKYKNITTGVDNKGFFGEYFEARGVPYTAIYGRDKRLRKAFIGEVYSRQIKRVSED